MADAMTNNIRCSAGNDTRSIRGEAWSTEVFVSDAMALADLARFSTCGHLDFDLYDDHQQPPTYVAPWKSSVLVTLLQGLSKEIGGHFSPDASPSELEAVAQKLRVKLATCGVDDKLVAV
jgi:hypothetical protein